MKTHSIKRVRPALLAIAMLTLAAPAAFAVVINPTYTSFGSLPDATFGGAGIPNNAVTITRFVDGNNTITLGMAAFQRYSNPTVTDNGAGVYQATTGANFGDPLNPGGPGPGSSLGATWGFGWYIDIQGGGTLQNYNFSLLYDFDAAANTDSANLGVLTQAGMLLAGVGTTSTGASTNYQSAQNMLSAFWGTPGFPAFILPPSGSFDPNAAGEYTLALQARNQAGALLGTSSILVNVAAVPEPQSLALLGVALMGIGIVRRRRQQA